MRKHLSPILLLLSLSCVVIVSACNSGYSDPNTPGPQPPAEPHASVLSECGATIRLPGTYSLSSGLTTDLDGEPCISIAQVNNVTLDCQGNSITGTGDYGIGVLNVENLVIKNCGVATGNNNVISIFLALNNVNGATVADCTFGSNQGYLGEVLISDSTNVIFGAQLPSAPMNPSVTATTNPSISPLLSNAPPASNTVYGLIQAYNNVKLVIEGDALTSDTTTTLNPFMIGIGGNQDTQVVKNTVNGLGNPISYLQGPLTGSDDDILIEDETGPLSLVSGNVLVNTFDCAVETVGFMKDIGISKNYIDTVTFAFGGEYYLSVTDAQYAGNAMTNIMRQGFYYVRSGPLRPAGAQNLPYFFYPIPAHMPAESTINFTQNQFNGNTLSQPLLFNGELLAQPVVIPVYTTMGYGARGLPGTDPTLQQFITVDNIFTDNIFDKALGPLYFNWPLPWTYTNDDVIDGGGNVCAPSQVSLPSVSPTFSDQTVPLSSITPIDCRSGS